MPLYYCKHCGSGTQSSSSVPSFCSSCGKPFYSSGSVKTNTPVFNKEQKTSIAKKEEAEKDVYFEFEQDDDISRSYIPPNDSIEIVGETARGVKFEDILNQKPQGTERPTQKIKGKKAKSELKDRTLKEYKKEGGPTDRSNITILGTAGE